MNNSGLWGRFGRWLSDPQLTILWVAVLILIGFIVFWVKVLAPFITAAILAYLLNGMVRWLVRRRLPQGLAVALVFCGFMAALIALIIWLVPLIIEQLSALAMAIPSIAAKLQQIAVSLHAKYAAKVPPALVQDLIPRLTTELQSATRGVVTYLLTGLPNLFVVFIYFVLVPLLVFLFLKDKKKITDYFCQFLPREHDLLTQVLCQIDRQMVNFLLGKFWEIVIVGVATALAFFLFDLRFALIMSLLSGLSVIIPYLGVLLAVVPISLVAFFQFGLELGFWKIIISYVIIQLLDGYLLWPLMVGNLIQIHPAAVLFAVAFFGYLWGFWGVFFALPLAIAVKAILDLAMSYVRRQENGSCAP